jgi:methylated-DNA-[protein]-cysteine S-methyltransferase
MSNIINIQCFSTSYGELIIGEFNDRLCLCDWRYRKMRDAIDNRIKRGLSAEYRESNSPVIEQTKSQLTDYFNQNLQEFNLPLLFVGTEFQKQVWEELVKIPYGQTRAYLQLSKLLGNEKAIRAVASANGANAISIIVPCHRIIGSNGELVGYAGGISAKNKLLRLENAINKDQLSMF